MNILALVGVGGLAAGLLVWLVVTRRAKLGSVVVGALCGVLMSAGWRIGPVITTFVTNGLSRASSWLDRAVVGQVPAAGVVPSWAWQLVVILAGFALVGIAVAFLNGGNGSSEGKGSKS